MQFLLIFCYFIDFLLFSSDMAGWAEKYHTQCQGEQLLSDDLSKKTVSIYILI